MVETCDERLCGGKMTASECRAIVLSIHPTARCRHERTRSSSYYVIWISDGKTLCQPTYSRGMAWSKAAENVIKETTCQMKK